MTLNLVRRSTKGAPLTAIDHDGNLDKIEQAIEGIELTPGPAGPAGAAGDDGREVELQTSATHVQWRYVGDVAWTDLVALSAIAGPQGPAGATGAAGAAGAAATVGVGTVTTGAAGSSASVSNAGTSSAAVLNFTIPRGDTGPAGAAGTAATVAVGTVTTGAAGSSAAVSNSGTSSAAVFNFTIPRGDTGATGATGPQGPQGPAGSDATATPLSTATPQAPGTAAAGTASSAARGDHVHPLPAVATTSAAGLMPALSFAAITYAADVELDMAALDGQVRTISLTGNLSLTSINRAAGRSVTLRIIADGTQRTLTFPSGWVFIGSKPANIAASKTGVLSLTFFGTASTDAVAAWGVQA